MLIHLTLSTTELKEIHLQCHISSIKENVKFLISVSAKGPFLEDANNILFSPCGVGNLVTHRSVVLSSLCLKYAFQ